MNYPEFFTIPILKKTAKMLFLGLEQLHKMHIIHCDLKPENILIKSF
jgi:serine/threonine protein kinase